MTTTVLIFVYACKRFAEHGWDIWVALAAAFSIPLGTVFVRRQHQLPDPLIDLRLFREPMFNVALAVDLVAVFSAFAAFLFVAQCLQLVVGMTPLEASIWVLPCGLVLILGSLAAPALARRSDARTLLCTGFLLSALGYAVLSTAYGSALHWKALTGCILFCIPLAPMAALTTNLIVSAAPPNKAGSASGISESSFELGAALGVAILGSLAVMVYRTSMASAHLQGVSPDVRAAAQDTLGSAIHIAESLPIEVRTPLVAVARDAFMQSMHSSLLVSCLLALVASIACHRWIPSSAPTLRE